MRDDTEARLLLAILARRWQLAERLVAARPPDAQSFVALCRACDVPSWVHALLLAEGRGDLVGNEIVERLGRLRVAIQRDTLQLLAMAEHAADLLAAAGVVPIALKGLDFLHRLYGRFDERTIDDIDLLVRRAELPAALDALTRGGWQPPPEAERTRYVRSSHHLPLRSPAPIEVEIELHWNLAQQRRYQIDVEGLFERAEPLVVSGRQLLRLADHDAAAHLLLHHFTHYFDRRLKWLVDLEALARQPGFDWGAVATRVRSWGAVSASGMSLRHLRKLSPEWIPPTMLDQLPVSSWRVALTWPLRSSHPLEMFRWTRSRRVQLYLAAVLLERPTLLPGWLVHRARRTRRPTTNPLDRPE